jgi:hypothetical protein
MSKFHVIDFVIAARQMVGPSLSITKALEKRRASSTIDRKPHQGTRERQRRLRRMAKKGGQS